jgi:uncharacterized membrane protein YhaH (DUF805 family)
LSKQIEQRNADLAARVKALIVEAEKQQLAIQQYHAQGNYPAAIAAAEALASSSEPELAEYVSWTEGELQTLRSELSDWQQKRAKWLVDAQSMLGAGEFASAIELLEQLPLTMRSLPGDGSDETAMVHQLLEHSETALAKQQKRERLLETFKESKQLVRELRSGYRHQQAIEILEPLVHEDIVAVYGGDKELATSIEWAREQLSVLREEHLELLRTQGSLLAAARKSVKQYDYAEAVRLLNQNQIPDAFRDFACSVVLEESQQALEEVQGLRSTISQAVKDKAYDGLLEIVNSYLDLNPVDSSVQKIRTKLVRREKRLEQKRSAREAAEQQAQERQAAEQERQAAEQERQSEIERRLNEAARFRKRLLEFSPYHSWKKLFVLDGRSSRTAFLGFFLPTYCIPYFLYLIVVIALPGLNEKPLLLIVGILWVISVVPLFTLSVRRLHDTNRSGGWICLVVLPFINWYLLFLLAVCPGTKGLNDYGRDL